MSNFKRTLRIVFSLFLLLGGFASCSKEEQSKKDFVYNKGKLTILTDDAFKSVATAIAEAYAIRYPESEVRVEVKKEDLAFLDLLNHQSKLVIMSRQLSEKEIKEYERVVDLKFNPAHFAADAVVFVVPKDSPKEFITEEEIKQALNSEDKPLVFDGTNSGNLNFVAQKFNKKPTELKFSTISGNENVIKEISKYSGKIGVVSLNTISRPYGKEAMKLREMVKVLPVKKDGKLIQPMAQNLIEFQYPFTRVLYFLSNEGNFGIANGVMRFACTQIGQIVVEKEGLQPYYLFKREVEMR